MMNMGDMMDRCMEAMSSMTGDGIVLVVLPALILIWVIGLAAVGALIFWGVRRLSRPHA